MCMLCGRCLTNISPLLLKYNRPITLPPPPHGAMHGDKDHHVVCVQIDLLLQYKSV